MLILVTETSKKDCENEESLKLRSSDVVLTFQ